MAWSRNQLLAFQREGQKLDAIAPGLNGCDILEVRDSDVIVKTQFPGKAYVQFASIRTTAPKIFGPGARVQTPYGRAVVKEYRESESDISYVVDYVDKGATGGCQFVVIYIYRQQPTVAANCSTANQTVKHRSLARCTPAGYLRPADVKERTDLTFAEAYSDAEQLRAKGNAAFKARTPHHNQRIRVTVLLQPCSSHPIPYAARCLPSAGL